MVNRTATLFALLLSFSVLAASKPQPLPAMTPEKWRADVDFFARELPRRHKNAFHTITREQFAAEVAALREKSSRANDDEMIVGLMRITAMVGDGHTYVRLPSSIHQFPITLARIEGANRVVRGRSEEHTSELQSPPRALLNVLASFQRSRACSSPPT